LREEKIGVINELEGVISPKDFNEVKFLPKLDEGMKRKVTVKGWET